MHIKEITNVRTVATVGVMAATLECAKLVLSFLPNIEILSLLTAIFGYVFGWAGVVSSFIFVLIEPLIWGFGPWFITYLIYWPSLALVFMLLGRRGVSNRWIISAIALLMTVGFGLISAVIDCALYLGINEHYPKNLLIYYLRGIGFYLAQIGCNAVFFPTLFIFLSAKLSQIKDKMML